MKTWHEWIQNKTTMEILKVQVPHNVTYWIRHDKICANDTNCCHNFFKNDQDQPADFNKPLEYTKKGVEHFGYGFCRDCYLDLGLGSGIKTPGNK